MISSIGTIGTLQKLGMPLENPSTVICAEFYALRFVLRPITRNKDLFNFVVFVREGDPASIAQPKALVDFIHNVSERHELEFGEFHWLSYFRFVSVAYVRNASE